MTLGEFREKTKNISDDYNLILSIYSDVDGFCAITDIDSMGCEVDKENKEVLIKN